MGNVDTELRIWAGMRRGTGSGNFGVSQWHVGAVYGTEDGDREGGPRGEVQFSLCGSTWAAYASAELMNIRQNL